ncbi:ribose-5-phosphate isomerase RpiA [Bartonella sp. HY038]|uniref:ribose-5-phosphate isomerase RpiA n=1 Tax=Bartonella sp. HY038 TaxID=2759660 RepID=UPI0015FE5698|nr:ribose-5-phosphate isomerase RpiA [Bartonella sp. HY038]
MQDAHQLKIAAAAKALEYVSDGMRLGIGTGSTANEFIKLLATRVNDGLRVCGVPTSQRSADLCRELGVPLATLEEMPELDLTIDGADEIGPNLSLIKGGGGALLREKIVAAASKQMLVIADSSKIVEKLGAFPLPIEVNQFGLAATKHAIEKAALTLGLSGAVSLRHDGNKPYVTDGGHFILDASFGVIIQPQALADSLVSIPGVVEHGMFLGLAGIAIIADKQGEILVLSR